MYTFNLFNVTDISFDSPKDQLEMNIREVQKQGFYIISLNRELNNRIQIKAQKLLKDMPLQTYEMLNVEDTFRRWEQIRQDARNQKYTW